MWRGAGFGAMGGLWLAFGCGPSAPAQELEAPRSLVLLHTSDLHSRLWPFRARISSFEAAQGLGAAGALVEVGGAARLASVLGRERQRGAALWLDSGDALEGAPVFERYGGRVELELLGALGLSAMALGNHELSLSAEALGSLLGTARFPVLSANLRPREGSVLAGHLAPSAVIEAGGLRLGIVGVANPDSPPGLGDARNAWGLEAEAATAATVQLAIDELASRAELVIVLSHLGLDADHELVRATSGIGLVLGGHQHVLTAEPEWERDCATGALRELRGCAPTRVPIVHSGAYGKWLSRLSLELSWQPSGRLAVSAAKHEPQPITPEEPEAPEVVEYLAPRRPPPEPPLAYLATPLPRRSPLGADSGLGDLTTDAVRVATGADVALLNSSGLREDLEAGVLLRSDLELAFPFAEPWRRLVITGAMLRRGLFRAALRSAARGCESVLQVAGLELELHCSACQQRADDCLRVTRPSNSGARELGDDERLLVVLPSYLTLPGADFEDAALGAELELSVPKALARRVTSSARLVDPAPCQRELVAWPEERCREAFAPALCPLSTERARDVCAALPVLERERDGRIQTLP